MTLAEFTTAVIEAGLLSIEDDPQLQRHPKRMQGSREGFEACRGKSPNELRELLEQANTTSETARRERTGDIEDYWRARYFALQVEWVCNTVSAVLMNEDLPIIVPVTARGAINAAKILKRAESVS
jgi:hypothetical protein